MPSPFKRTYQSPKTKPLGSDWTLIAFAQTGTFPPQTQSPLTGNGDINITCGFAPVQLQAWTFQITSLDSDPSVMITVDPDGEDMVMDIITPSGCHICVDDSSTPGDPETAILNASTQGGTGTYTVGVALGADTGAPNTYSITITSLNSMQDLSSSSPECDFLLECDPLC